MVQEKGSRQRCSSWTVLQAQSTSVLSSKFPLSQGNAEALDKWGGKTKHHLISYFLSNTSSKNYHNQIVYEDFIASQRWDVLSETQSTATITTALTTSTTTTTINMVLLHVSLTVLSAGNAVVAPYELEQATA